MRLATFCVLLAALALAACGSSGPGGSEKAAKAAEIADAIAADPGRTDAILEEHGMTIEELEALLYEIAEDPELTREYERLRKVEDPR